MDLLLMVEKDIRGGICDFIYWYAKPNNTWKIVVQIKNCHIFKTGM